MVHSQLGTVSGPIMYPLTSTPATLRADQQGCQKRLNGCSSRQPSGSAQIADQRTSTYWRMVGFVTEPTKKANQRPTGEQDTAQNPEMTNVSAGHHGGP